MLNPSVEGRKIRASFFEESFLATKAHAEIRHSRNDVANQSRPPLFRQTSTSIYWREYVHFIVKSQTNQGGHMKLTRLFFAITLFPAALLGRTIIVDVNGSGQFTSIVAAMSAAVNGDTVKVLPGDYTDAFTISKNIVLMGSGYETTRIASNGNPAVTMTAGKMMWFAVTSNQGDGIWFSGGQITNCVIRGCTQTGIRLKTNASGIISNCVILENVGFGVTGESGNSVAVYNCISRNNTDRGYNNLTVNYSNGSGWYAGGIANIDSDPKFTSSIDFRISSTSPCWDTGKADVLDPDGSRSDMGYFGGPDCPIYPVVVNVRVTATTGGVQIQATGRANY
jgi:hypothetical protein